MQVKNEALPPEFVERLHRILNDDDFGTAIHTMNEPRRTSFRVNTLRADVEPTVHALREAGIKVASIDWYDAAFYVEPAFRQALLESEAYRAQHIYVQNAASMLPVLPLAPTPAEHVLDLAAAPGSKTLQIVCEMDNEGEVAAVEIVRERFYKLNNLLKLQGAEIVRTFLRNGMTVWRHRPDHFDRVLLDAPCSSEGRFHTSRPETFAYWSPRKVKEMARKQRKLLSSAVKSLRPGGILVYSTCSYAPEENELALTDILIEFEGKLEVEPFEPRLPNMRRPLEEWDGREVHRDVVEHARRVVPDDLCDGFFICRMRKR